MNIIFFKTVSLSFRNVKNVTGKVTYGFEIVNTSNQAGYVKLIEENIPYGMTFNPEYEQNKGWFSVNGNVYYDAFSDVLLQPGERKTFEIILDIVSSEEARVLLNEVSIVELEPYEDEEIVRPEDEYQVNNFEIGSSISYAGVNWHVINDDGKNVTLLADQGEITTKMSHTKNPTDIYKWSKSQINNYINNTWLNRDSGLDSSVLIESSVCDDASGLQVASFGGTLLQEGTCHSGIYNNYKVRLLTQKEYDNLLSKLTDASFLIDTEAYWLMNSVYKTHETDDKGTVLNNISNTAICASKAATTLMAEASVKLGVRPVITVSKSNVLIY